MMSKKQALLDQIFACELRIIGFERNRNTTLYSKRHEFRSLYCTLEELDIKLNSERRIWKQALQQEISRIRSNVDTFHSMLSEMKPDPAFVEKLKQTMEGIETSIVAFKEKQRETYESLLLEEQNATQEVNAFDRKLESWLCISKATHIKPEVTTSAPPKPASTSIPLPVLAFERFLHQTGRQGGWDDYDHQTFLKIRRSRAAGGGAGFLEAVAAELPTKTVEEIKQHEQWYAEFSTLLASKRRAIDKWREVKTAKKPVRRSPSNTRKKSSKQELLEKEREARFSKLDTWKAEQKRRLMEAEELKLKKEQEEAKLKEMEDRRRVALKNRVEEFARQREAEVREHEAKEEAKRLQELAERRLANKELEKFRARDMSVVVEKRKKAEAKEAEKQEREKRLEMLKEQVEVKAQRDPSRLYKLTKGWEERKKVTTEPRGGGASMSLPKRAVPSWRQGV